MRPKEKELRETRACRGGEGTKLLRNQKNTVVDDKRCESHTVTEFNMRLSETDVE